MLIEAFKQFKSENINAILVIIGRGITGGTKSRHIKEFVESEVKKNKFIHWIGEKHNATDYLHLSNYFCLSSHWEGMPISLLEAFAAQCIPVCTKVGEIPQMITDGKEGYLAESITQEAYAKALHRAYQDSENEKKPILQQQYEQQYSMEYCAQRYIEYYKKILNLAPQS